jgi:hypothetical protein
LKSRAGDAATKLVPSAEQATEVQLFVGALFAVQVAPKSAEVQIPPPEHAATSLPPSLEKATSPGADAPVCAQVAPELVEM